MPVFIGFERITFLFDPILFFIMPEGIVLMMDALGISHYTTKECVDFLEKIKRIENTIYEIKTTLKDDRQAAIFGDSVVICWPLDKKITDYQKIKLISLEVTILIHKGLENGLLFRGCISVGEYVTENNIFLGPAIFDAHDWYEMTDWFGIIFSPKARIWLDSILENEKSNGNYEPINDFEKRIIPYNVPLSQYFNEQKTKNFYAIGWPYWYHYLKSKENKKSSKELFLNDLFKIPHPKEGESKFKNSIDFFDYCSQKYPLKTTKNEN